MKIITLELDINSIRDFDDIKHKITNDTILIKFNSSKKNYQIKFIESESPNSNKKELIIDGGDNDISFVNGKILSPSFSFRGDTLRIGNEFSIRALNYECSTKYLDNYGSIEARNFNINGKSYINHPVGRVRVKTAKFNLNHFIDRGLTFIEEAEITSKTINLFGYFGVISAKFKAKRSICFNENSTTEFFQHLYCEANQRGISINGTVKMNKYFLERKNNSGKLTCNATYVHLSNLANIRYCKAIDFTARQYCKVDPHSQVDGKTYFTLNAPLISYHGRSNANTAIQLLASHCCIISPEAELHSRKITLSGWSIYLYGLIKGQLEFKQPISSLYLASSAIIQNTQNLEATAVHITHYGSVRADVVRLIAKHSIRTHAKSLIKSKITDIRAQNAEVSGHYASQKLSIVGDTVNAHDLDITSSEPALLGGQHVNLEGLIEGNNSSINFASKTVINNSILQHFHGTSINAEQTLITINGSSVNTETLDVLAGDLHHHGCFKGHKYVVTKTKRPLYIGSTGSVDTDQWQSESEADVLIAGSVSVNQCDLQNNGTVCFIPKSNFEAKLLRVRSNNIYGEVDLDLELGLLQSSHENRIFSGVIKAKQDFIFKSNSNNITVNFHGSNFYFYGNDNIQNTRLCLNSGSNIDCDTLSSNHDSQYIAANIQRSNTIVLNATQNITIAPSANIKNNTLIAAKTTDLSVAGRIQGTDQSKVVVESENARFHKESSVACDYTQVTTRTANLLGELFTGDLRLQAESANYRPGSTTHATRQIVNSGTDKALLTLYMHLGAQLYAQLFAVNKSTLIINEIILRIYQILIETGHLENAISGQIGCPDTYLQVACATFHHLGILESAQANIKCDDYFFQDGVNGIGRIRATQFNLTASFYYNYLCVTEAQQAAILTYGAIRFGLDKINFGYHNSFVLIKAFPTIPDIYFLLNWAKDVRKGNISLLDPNYLQYISPFILKSLEQIGPVISLGASLGLNSYFFINAIQRLVEYSGKETPQKAVDWLPILLTIKNGALAGSSLVSDLADLGYELKYNLPKWVSDYVLTCISGILIVDDIMHMTSRMIIKALHKAENILFSTTHDDDLDDLFDSPYMPQWVKDLRIKDETSKHKDKRLHDRHWLEKQIDKQKHKEEVHQAKQHKKELADAQKNAAAKSKQNQTDLTKLEQVELFFEKWILPTVTLIAPRCIEDDIFSLRLFAPAVLAYSSERDLLGGVSIYSRIYALVVNKQSLGNIYCFNSNVAYSVNFSGYYVYTEGLKYVHNINIRANNFDIRDGDQIDATAANLDVKNLKPLNLKAARLSFKVNDVSDKEKLLRLDGRWKIFVHDDLKTVSYEVNEPLTINHSFNANWSYFYIAPEIIVPHHITLRSKNVVGLRSTQSNIEVYGRLKAKTIVKNSAKDIIQKRSHSQSEYLYDHAYYNIHYDDDKIKTVDGNISTDMGSINNSGSHVSASRTLFVDAMRDRVIVASSSDTHHKGVFAGGNGLGHDFWGLFVHGGVKVINDAGKFTAHGGSSYIRGDFGVSGSERHHWSAPKHHWKINWFTGVTTHKKVATMKINRPIFESKGGSLYLIAKYGSLDITCGGYRATNAVFYHSFFEPNFGELKFTRCAITDKSILFSFELSKSIDHRNEYVSQHIHSRHLIVFEVRIGDFKLRNTTLDTAHLITIVPEGNITLVGTPLEHQVWSRYLNFGVRLGPVQYSYSANPNVKQANDVSLKFSPINNFQAATQSHSAVEAGVNLVNTATSSVNAADEICSAEISVGYTSSKMHYQAPNPHYLRIGCWEMDTNQAQVDGMSGVVYRLYTHTAIAFSMNGYLLSYSQVSENVTISGTYHFLTHSFSGSGSGTHSTMSGKRPAITHLTVHELYCDNPIVITLHNASMPVHSLHGTVSKVNEYTDYSVFTQQSGTVSFSTQGDIGANYHQSKGHEIGKASEFRLDDAHNGQVLGLYSDGGKISGKGISPTTSVQQRPNNSWREESSYGFSWSTKNNRPNSVNFQTTSDEYNFSIEKCENGYVTISDQAHHGIDIHLTMPYDSFVNILKHPPIMTFINFFSTILSNNNQVNANDKPLPRLLCPNYLSPEMYAHLFNVLQKDQPQQAKKLGTNTKQNARLPSESPAVNSQNTHSPQAKARAQQNLGLPYQSPYDVSHYASSFNVLNSDQRPAAVTTYLEDINLNFDLLGILSNDPTTKFLGPYVHLIIYSFYPSIEKFYSRFNYPVGDYLMGGLRGLGDAAKGIYHLAAVGTQWVWDLEMIYIHQPWHKYFPNIVTTEMIERSSQRLHATNTALKQSAEKLGHFANNLAFLSAVQQSLPLLSENDRLLQRYHLAATAVNNDLAPIKAAIVHGSHWLLFEASGPELVEVASCLYGPSKIISKLDEMYNMYHYGIKIKPEVYRHVDGITEPKPLGKLFTVDEITNDEFNAKLFFVITTDAKLLISDKKIELPYVLAAGGLHIDSGSAEVLRIDEILKKDLIYYPLEKQGFNSWHYRFNYRTDGLGKIFYYSPEIFKDKSLYFPTGKHIPDLLRYKFNEFGLKSAINHVNEGMISFPEAELKYAPPVIQPTTWTNSHLIKVYSAWQSTTIDTNHDWLTPSHPWSYPLREYLAALGNGGLRIIMEPFQLSIDTGIIITNNLSPFTSLTLSDETYLEAKNHLTNSSVACIGHFMLDVLNQYALADTLHSHYDEEVFREYQRIQNIQQQRLNRLAHNIKMFLFYESGPYVVETIAELLIPYGAVKAVTGLRNYSLFGTFSHPPLFNPLYPKSDFTFSEFVNGKQNINNYLLSLERIRTDHNLPVANYVINQKRELRIVDQELAEHPILGEFQPVYVAGEVYFKDGKLSEINAGSGNYQPYGAHLENLVVHIFKKHGFDEAPLVFKDRYNRFPSENVAITINQWHHHLFTTFFFTLDDQHCSNRQAPKIVISDTNNDHNLKSDTHILGLPYKGPYDLSNYGIYFNVLQSNQSSSGLSSLLPPTFAAAGWSIYKIVSSAPQWGAERLYRGDSRTPHDEIFQSGFKSQGINIDIRATIYPTYDSLKNSGFVSATTSREVAKAHPHHTHFADDETPKTYVYLFTKQKNAIDGNEAIRRGFEQFSATKRQLESVGESDLVKEVESVIAEYEDALSLKDQNTWLIHDKVDPTTIKGAWEVTTYIKQIDDPNDIIYRGYSPEFIRENCFEKVRVLHEDSFVANPNYVPLNIIDSPRFWQISKVVGHGFVALGFLLEASNFYHELRLSQQTGDYTNTHRTLASIFAGWSMGYAVGAASAKVGAIICTPLEPFGPVACGIIFGAGGSLVGYAIGSFGAKEVFDSLQSSEKPFIHNSRHSFFAQPPLIEYPTSEPTNESTNELNKGL